jgi:hypothetical protein
LLAQNTDKTAIWQYDSGEAFMRALEFRREEERRRSVVDLSYEPMSRDANGIIREICAYRGVTLKEVRSKSRVTRLVRTRQEIAYWLRRRTKLSFTQIGKKMNQDHTTPISSVKAYCARFNMPMDWEGVNTRTDADLAIAA